MDDVREYTRYYLEYKSQWCGQWFVVKPKCGYPYNGKFDTIAGAKSMIKQLGIAHETFECRIVEETITQKIVDNIECKKIDKP